MFDIGLSAYADRHGLQRNDARHGPPTAVRLPPVLPRRSLVPHLPVLHHAPRSDAYAESGPNRSQEPGASWRALGPPLL